MSDSSLKSARKLDQPLPADVAVGSPRWWLAYRSYPVFSAPWVARRALLFGMFIVAWGGLSGIAHYAQGGSGRDALELFGWFVLGFGTIVNAGPVLAALVRHRRWSPRLERVMVLMAMTIGLFLALIADALSSARIAELADQSFDREITGTALAINVLVLLALYLMLGGGLAVRAYFSESRRMAEFDNQRAMEQLKADKLIADQQLAMLQAQIEPHFLFNTLATIRSELRGQPEQAEQTLDALCNYLRATIPRLRDGEAGVESTVGEQFKIADHYLKVMQGRMRDRLTYALTIEPGLESAPFPPFLLLTLVENAIRHGLEPRPEGGRIDMRVSRADQRLRMKVSDNGVGMSGEIGSGVGLSNIRKQLRLRFGDQARLSLSSPESGGVDARIELPLEE